MVIDHREAMEFINCELMLDSLASDGWVGVGWWWAVEGCAVIIMFTFT